MPSLKGGRTLKISITMDNFPMRFLPSLEADLAKHVKCNIQVGGEDTVFVNCVTEDVVKGQIVVILCDKYRFGGDNDDSSVCGGNEEDG